MPVSRQIALHEDTWARTAAILEASTAVLGLPSRLPLALAFLMLRALETLKALGITLVSIWRPGLGSADLTGYLSARPLASAIMRFRWSAARANDRRSSRAARSTSSSPRRNTLTHPVSGRT